MALGLRFDLDDDDDGDVPTSRRGAAPERSNRRPQSHAPQKRARRNRSNEVAKRGMHQRRNRRVSW